MRENKKIYHKTNSIKFKIVISVCCLVIILAGIIGGVIYFIQNNNSSVQEAKVVVADFLEAYKAKEPNAFKYLQYSVTDEDMKFEGFQGFLAEQIDFKIKDGKATDNQVTITVDITNIDLKCVFEDVIAQLPSNATEEEILQKLESELSKEDCAKKEFNCEVTLVNEDEYKIIMTDTLSNALLGGYNEYLAEMIEEQEG